MRRLFRSAGIAGQAVPDVGGFSKNSIATEAMAVPSAPPPIHFTLELPGTGLGIPTLPDNACELVFPTPAGPRPAFTRSVFPLQVLLLSSILIAVAAGFFPSEMPTLTPAGLLILIIVVIVCRYRSEPAVVERMQARIRVRAAERAMESARRRVAARDAKLQDVRSAEKEQLKELEAEVEAVTADERREHQMLEKAICRATDVALLQLEQLDHQEELELQRVHDTLGAEVFNVLQKINQSIFDEGVERTTALHNVQENYVQQQLEQVTLDGAIPGVGQFVANNLAKDGIRTAADCIRLTEIKVLGVGPHRIAAILAWRQKLIAKARLTMPMFLNASEENVIRERHAPWRALLQSQLSTAQDALKAKQKAIQDEYAHSCRLQDGRREISTHRLDQDGNVVDSKRRREALEEAIMRVSAFGTAIAQSDRDYVGHRELLKSLRWRVAKAKAELRWFESVSFRRYCRRLVNER